MTLMLAVSQLVKGAAPTETHWFVPSALGVVGKYPDAQEIQKPPGKEGLAVAQLVKDPVPT